MKGQSMSFTVTTVHENLPPHNSTIILFTASRISAAVVKYVKCYWVDGEFQLVEAPDIDPALIELTPDQPHDVYNESDDIPQFDTYYTAVLLDGSPNLYNATALQLTDLYSFHIDYLNAIYRNNPHWLLYHYPFQEWDEFIATPQYANLEIVEISYHNNHPIAAQTDFVVEANLMNRSLTYQERILFETLSFEQRSATFKWKGNDYIAEFRRYCKSTEASQIATDDFKIFDIRLNE